METLQEIAEKLIQIGKDMHYAKISLAAMYNLHCLASGHYGDFVIFNNAGGMPFSVWSGDAVQGIVHSDLAKFVYAYRLGGKNAVIKLPIAWKGHIDWVPADRYKSILEEIHETT